MQLRPRKRSFWKRVSLVMRHCLSLGATVLTVSGITRSSVQAQSVDTAKANCDTKSKGIPMKFDSVRYKPYERFTMGVVVPDPPEFWEDREAIERSFFEQIKSILLSDKEFLLRKGKKESQEIK